MVVELARSTSLAHIELRLHSLDRTSSSSSNFRASPRQSLSTSTNVDMAHVYEAKKAADRIRASAADVLRSQYLFLPDASLQVILDDIAARTSQAIIDL